MQQQHAQYIKVLMTQVSSTSGTPTNKPRNPQQLRSTAGPLTQWAAAVDLVAEGRAALHAARRLRVQLVRACCCWRVLHHLPPVLEPLCFRPVAQRLAVVLQEAARLQNGRVNS
jgi:hypothetical protein